MSENRRSKKPTIDNISLFDYEAEQCLLSAIFIADEEADDIIAVTKKEYFYDDRNKKTFQAMQTLSNEGKQINLITLSDTLEKEGLINSIGGISYLATIANLLPSHVNYRTYLDIIKRDSILRDIIEISNKNIAEAYSAKDAERVLAECEERLLAIGGTLEDEKCVHVSTAISKVMDKFEKIIKNMSYDPGIRSGYAGLDEIIKGFKPGQLVIIAARPGCGKTSMALDIVCNNVDKRKHVLIFNMEMSAEEVTEKMIYNLSKVPLSHLYRKDTDNMAAFTAITEATAKIDDTQIFIEDTAGMTVDEISSRCRRYQRQHKALDFVVVDYLQLLSVKDKKDNRQQEVAEISRSLKIMAKKLNVPIIVLSQLSRGVDKRTDKRLMLSDLRDSGAIEQDADIVIFLSNPDEGDDAQATSGAVKEKTPIDLSVAKHRNGRVGDVKLFFYGALSKFVDCNVKINVFSDKASNATKEDVMDYVPNPDVPEILEDAAPPM